MASSRDPPARVGEAANIAIEAGKVGSGDAHVVRGSLARLILKNRPQPLGAWTSCRCDAAGRSDVAQQIYFGKERKLNAFIRGEVQT